MWLRPARRYDLYHSPLNERRRSATATEAFQVIRIGRLRKRLNLTQEEFAARFHLPLGTERDWEQGAHRPDKAAQVLLRVIAKDPDAVARALNTYS